MPEADTLIRAKYLITMAESEKEMQKDMLIAVDSCGRILDIYKNDVDKKRPWMIGREGKYEAKNVVGVDDDALVMPGMINCHGHAPMETYRGQIPDGIPFEEVLFKHMFPLEQKNIAPMQVAYSTIQTIDEMKKGGVTTTAEMYYYTETMAHQFKKFNMRAVLGETIMSHGTYPFDTPAEAFSHLERLAREGSDDYVTFAVAPHAPYTVNDEDLRKCVMLAKSLDIPLLMHMSETKEEVRSMFYNGRNTRRRPMKHLEDIGLFEHGKVTLGHCVYIHANEMNVLAKHDAGVAFNAVCNALLGLKVARVPEMRELGINVGLATDGPLTNDRLDMFSNMSTAMALLRSAYQDSCITTCYDMVRMATIDAAKALHIDRNVGSLEVGKFADMVVLGVKTDRQKNYMKNKEPYQYLVKNAARSDIDRVLVGGKEYRNSLGISENFLKQ